MYTVKINVHLHQNGRQCITLLLKQIEANISSVMNAKTFLSISVVIILRSDTNEQSMAFKAVE